MGCEQRFYTTAAEEIKRKANGLDNGLKKD